VINTNLAPILHHFIGVFRIFFGGAFFFLKKLTTFFKSSYSG